MHGTKKARRKWPDRRPAAFKYRRGKFVILNSDHLSGLLTLEPSQERVLRVLLEDAHGLDAAPLRARTEAGPDWVSIRYSHRELADRARLARSTVQGAVRALAAAGLLAYQGGSGGRPSTYRLTADHLERLAGQAVTAEPRPGWLAEPSPGAQPGHRAERSPTTGPSHTRHSRTTRRMMGRLRTGRTEIPREEDGERSKVNPQTMEQRQGGGDTGTPTDAPRSPRTLAMAGTPTGSDAEGAQEAQEPTRAAAPHPGPAPATAGPQRRPGGATRKPQPPSVARLRQLIDARAFEGRAGPRADGVHVTNLQPWLERLAARSDAGAEATLERYAEAHAEATAPQAAAA